MLQLLRFPFKVWFTSVIGGSALYVLWIMIFEASDHTVLNGIFPLVFILSVIGGGVLSVPAFLLLWMAYWLLFNSSFTEIATKTTLIILSLILTFITIHMMPGVDEVRLRSSDNLDLLLCYWLTLVFAILNYKLDSPTHRERSGLEQ